ncbi:hypothetical protein GCM10010401_20350 [Rarobacter faecitabidus]|uniref:Uncharacterized protein n=1 Tax=Rarobacter faecitabidus TaxID=13243 RepID=A0A542ZVN9_RARFA|nr:hypothetical protein [Rarobacter faecitabidus]TQL64240.1 hypothetical protein FB461_0734 [Rarobacter faecitabidus]
MTDYVTPQYPAQPQYPGQPSPPKTATGLGKVLTFLGIALTVVCIGLIAVIVVNVAAMPKEITSGAVADESNGFTAEGLKAGRTYVIFPSVMTSTTSTRGNDGSDWSSSSSSSSSIYRISASDIVLEDSAGAVVDLAPTTFESLGTFIEEVLSPVGRFTATSDGPYFVTVASSAQVPTGFELTFVEQGTVDGIAAKARTAFIALIATIVLGFFASVFLIWGIILWAVRASRKRKLAQQAGNWGGPQPPQAGNWGGPQPPQAGNWGAAAPVEPQRPFYSE